MRSIYEFTIDKEVEERVETETDSGVLTTKEKIVKPIKIIFKKPSRAESEEADIVSAVEYADSVRKGILTRPLLEKLYDEKGGFLAENYDLKYGDLLTRFYELRNEFTRLDLKENKTEEDKTRINEAAVEFVTIQKNLQALESARNSLFQNTAETRAQNETIYWLTLFLTYIQEEQGKEPVPFFKGKTFQDKMLDYDKKVEDEDAFAFKVIDKMTFFTSLYFLGRAYSQEDFKNIEDSLNPPQEPSEPEKPQDQNDVATNEGMPEKVVENA